MTISMLLLLLRSIRLKLFPFVAIDRLIPEKCLAKEKTNLKNEVCVTHTTVSFGSKQKRTFFEIDNFIFVISHWNYVRSGAFMRFIRLLSDAIVETDVK